MTKQTKDSVNGGIEMVAAPVVPAPRVQAEEAAFEYARERDMFQPCHPVCPIWYATEFRREGWMARAASEPPQQSAQPEDVQRELDHAATNETRLPPAIGRIKGMDVVRVEGDDICVDKGALKPPVPKP